MRVGPIVLQRDQSAARKVQRANPSAVVGYNVYRRGTAAEVKHSSEPVTGTSYVDRTVQPGQATTM